jgi:hypothetical protein
MEGVLAERFNFPPPKLNPRYPEQAGNLPADPICSGVVGFCLLED